MNKEIDDMANENQKLKSEILPSNFKLNLIASLIRVNDFEDAELIIGSMWGDEKLDLTICPEILKSCFSMVDKMIEELYFEIAKNRSTSLRRNLQLPYHAKGIKTCRRGEELSESLPVLLRVLGVHVGLDSEVFDRLLRVVHYFMVPKHPKYTNIEQIAFKLTGEYFLPAITIQPFENV